MIPFGRSASRSASRVSYGRIRLYTCSSRTRRAISWLYCAPKSRTTIRSSTERGISGAVTSGAGSDDRARSARVRVISAPLADPLGDLQRLPLGRKRGGDDDLRLLHLAKRSPAAHPRRDPPPDAAPPTRRARRARPGPPLDLRGGGRHAHDRRGLRDAAA